MQVHKFRITNFNAMSAVAGEAVPAQNPDQTATPTISNIDEQAKIIRNVSVCSVGEAKGHDLWICKEFLQDLVTLGNEAGKVICHISHFNDCVNADPIETQVGYATNFRYDEASGKCLADFQFIVTEKDKEAIDKIFVYAKTEPQFLGISIVFSQKLNPNYNPDANNDEERDDENNDYYISYPDPEGQDRRYCSIGTLYACDVVGEPAVGNNLFSKDFFTQAGYATKALNGIKRFNKPMYKSIVSFFQRFFENEQKQSKKQEKQQKQNNQNNQKENMTTNTKKFSFTKMFSKRKEAPKMQKFGEIIGDDGKTYTYEGEMLEVGKVLNIVAEDGEAIPAPAGDHTMQDGTIVTTDEAGVITAIETPDQAMNAHKYAQKAFAQNTYDKYVQDNMKAMQEKMQSIEEQLKSTIGTNRFGAKASKETASEDDVKRFRSYILAAHKGEKTHNGKRIFKQSLSEEEATQKLIHRFATGTGVEAVDEVVEACARYSKRLLWELVYVEEGFFACITDFTTDSPYKPNNQFMFKFPLISLNRTGAGKGYIKLADPACGNISDKEVTGNVNLGEREIPVIPIEAFWKICPNEEIWRKAFNNEIFVDEETIPVEAIIMTLWAEHIRQDIIDMIINANSGAPTSVSNFGSFTSLNGFVKQILDDRVATNIPASQYFPLHTGWTPANAGTFLDEAVTAIPAKVKQKAQTGELQIFIYCAQTIFEKYRRGLANSNLYAINPYNDDPFRYYTIDGTPIRLCPSYLLNRQDPDPTSGADTGLYWISTKERTGHVHSDKKTAGSPKITYRDQVDDTIVARWAFYDGCGYPFADEIVTNI